MTDNEIIKSLECCVPQDYSKCSECPLDRGTTDGKWCDTVLMENALDLINRQQAEVERLQATVDGFTDIGKMYSEIKAESYKECIEKVKKELSFGKYITAEQLDNLLNELVGDENE